MLRVREMKDGPSKDKEVVRLEKVQADIQKKRARFEGAKLKRVGATRNRLISVYRFPHRALTHCPQLCMGFQPDALPATLYGHITQVIHRNWPIATSTHIDAHAEPSTHMLIPHSQD